MKLSSRLTAVLLASSMAVPAMAETWDVSVYGKRRAFTEHIEKLAELVSEKTNGEFTLNISYGGLSKPTENLDGIEIGAFQMAQMCAGYHADKNPSLTVLELPFLGVDTLEKEVAISRAVYALPAVQADLARWNATLLMPSPQPQYNIMGAGEPPKSLDYFKGKSVRATGGIGEALKALGAVPTSVNAPEVRQAMESGVVNLVAFAPHAHMAYGVTEIADWWTTNLNPGTVNCPVVVNTDALNALSEENREALLGSVDESLQHYVDNYNNVAMKAWNELVEKDGIIKVTFSDEDIAKLKAEIAEPAAQAWIEENTKRGLPAQEIYDFVVTELDKMK